MGGAAGSLISGGTTSAGGSPGSSTGGGPAGGTGGSPAFSTGGISVGGAAGTLNSGGTTSAGGGLGSSTGGGPAGGTGGTSISGTGGTSVGGTAATGGSLASSTGGSFVGGMTATGGVAGTSQSGSGGTSAGGVTTTGGAGGASGGATATGGGTTTGGSSGSTCPWATQADLDDAASAWAIYNEGSPTAVVESVAAPSASGGPALRCGLTGGSPYSNAHCYRNLPLTGNPQAFVMRLSFWYSPPSTFNNAGQASVVQGIEFSLSKWQAQARYELAVQWQNVGTGAPQWRYWDPNQVAAQRWLAIAQPQELASEQWHTLEIRGEGSNGTVHYRSFDIDGTAHPLDLTIPAASTPGESDRLAVAVQVDGNSAETPWDLVIDNLQLVTCDGATCATPTVSYRDSDGDGLGDIHKSVVTCQSPTGYVAASGDCNDADPLLQPASATAAFDVNRCGEGALLDGMEWSAGAGGWQVFTDGLGSAATGEVATGCHDNGMSVAYSLVASDQPNWISVRKVLPAAVDMSRADFLLTPFRGDATGLARTIEFKIEDASGCRSTVLFTAATPLPVFRTAVISLQRFTRPASSTCTGTPVDLTKIKAMEIGISEIGNDVPSPTLAASGQLTFDDFTFVSRDAMVSSQTFFECVPGRGDVMGRIARNFVRRQQPHGLIASWYPESPPNYYTYTEAMNLIVLSKEFARSGRTEYSTAAKAIADRLVALQAAGHWVDNYNDNGSGGLVAATTASWFGNVAWAMIGLTTFVQNAPSTDSTPYTGAIDLARTWLQQQIAAYQTAGGAAGGITDGVEGNVSTYFALVAAGATASAQAMSEFLTTQAWDTRERRLRMGVKDWGLAIDVTGNWGSEFFRQIQDNTRALNGLNLAAGVFPVRAFSSSVIGMGDIAGPWQPTVEFTGQYAAAGGHGAAWLMDQMLLLEDPNDPGAFPGSPNDFGGGDGWNTAMTGTSPSAWVYLGYGGGVLREVGKDGSQ